MIIILICCPSLKISKNIARVVGTSRSVDILGGTGISNLYSLKVNIWFQHLFSFARLPVLQV